MCRSGGSLNTNSTAQGSLDETLSEALSAVLPNAVEEVHSLKSEMNHDIERTAVQASTIEGSLVSLRRTQVLCTEVAFQRH